MFKSFPLPLGEGRSCDEPLLYLRRTTVPARCYKLLSLNDTKARLHYLDWLRGLAVLLMIQVHVTNSFLDSRFQSTLWWDFSQFLGGLAAPLFLFTAGISIALVFDRLVDRGASSKDLLKRTLKRSAWFFLLAYAFRVEQVMTWFPYGHWEDVWKIDILNCIAASSLMAGFAAAFTKDAKKNAVLLACMAAAIILLAPVIAPVRSGLPTLALSYINGNGRLDYFTFFPWAGYTFAGVAAGYLLIESRKLGRENQFMLWSAAVGALLFFIGYEVNRHLELLLGLASYSRPSPHYVFQKMGYVLILLYVAYRWPGSRRMLLLFGQTSLLIYWLHIEFVYGRLRMFRNSLSVPATAAQLLWLIPLMLGIAFIRMRWKAAAKQL